MSGVNKVIIIGNLGADPEQRTMPNGDLVVNISVATSENWKDKNTGEAREKTEWHRIVAYRRLAEIIAQYCHKGEKIYIEGKLQTRKWQDQSGQDRYITEIIADTMQMLSSKRDSSVPFERGAAANYSGGDYQYGAQNAPRQQQKFNNPAPVDEQYGGTAPSFHRAPSGNRQGNAPELSDVNFADENFDDDIPF